MKYYQVYQAPVWVVLYPSDKSEAVTKWFTKAEALIQPDISLGFKETVASFANKGWSAYFQEGKTLSDQLVNMAFAEHVKKNTISSATYDFPTSITCRLNRKVSTPEEYSALFNQMLEMVTPIELSYLFQVQEKCFPLKGEKYSLFLTPAGLSPKVIGTLAKQVITIGEGPDYNIDLLENATKSVSKFLETKLTAILGASK